MYLRVAILALATLSSAAAQQDLTHVLEAQRTAWNRGDLNTFMDSYWKSPDLTFFSGDTITKGWEATLERYRTKYQSHGAEMGELSFTDQHVEMLGPSGAVVTARWHLKNRDGQQREGLTTVVCKKTPAGWKIVHDHSS